MFLKPFLIAESYTKLDSPTALLARMSFVCVILGM